MPKSKPRSLPKEQFITFQQAAKTPPAHTHVNTIRRWAGPGCAGCVLESWRFGNRRVTSAEALERFFAATSQVGDTDKSGSDESAEAKLDAMGIL